MGDKSIDDFGPDMTSGPGSYYFSPTELKVWKKYFEQVFHNKVELTDKQVRQMATNQINFLSHEMGTVLDHALQVQKKLNKKVEDPDAADD